jgi:pimeloyl-ACP methyl ester carboxylesterase
MITNPSEMMIINTSSRPGSPKVSVVSPALVLLPGMDGTGLLFEPIVAALAPEVESIVVTYPDEPLSYAQLELIARAALPTDRPYVILGESFSGPIAITIAASDPANLIGYVLCASFVRSPVRLLRWLVPFLSFVLAKRLTHRFEQFVLMGRLATPSLRRLHLAAMEKVATATLVARAKAISACDVTEELRRVRVPGLYLRATQDHMVPRSATRDFEMLAPQACTVDIVGPHLLLQACATNCAVVLRAFLSQLSDRSSAKSTSS